MFGSFEQTFTKILAGLSYSGVPTRLLIIDNKVLDGCTYADPWVLESLLGCDSLGRVDS